MYIRNFDKLDISLYRAALSINKKFDRSARAQLLHHEFLGVIRKRDTGFSRGA